MRLVIASCSVDYSGRLDVHLLRTTCVFMLKVGGSVLIHSDGGFYKSLNWMSVPVRLAVTEPDEEAAADGVREVWEVSAIKTDDHLVTRLFETISDVSHEPGMGPGPTKDGVEAHLQEFLAEQIGVLGAGYRLVCHEFPTAIGPADIMARDAEGRSVAMEIKCVGEIDGVEQLIRYLELPDRDPLSIPVQGVFAAQIIKSQARVLAEDRDIRRVILDCDAMRGMGDPSSRLF